MLVKLRVLLLNIVWFHSRGTKHSVACYCLLWFNLPLQLYSVAEFLRILSESAWTIIIRQNDSLCIFIEFGQRLSYKLHPLKD